MEPKNAFNSYASPTPVLEHGRVYVTFGTYGSACLDTKTGNILWKNEDLRLDHKEGPGSSPILWKNYFLLHCDGMDVQYLAALDKETGRLVYRIDRTYPLNTLRPDIRKAYSTPTVAVIDGKEQLISLGSRCVYGYDPVDGKQLWHCDVPGFSNVPRPVYADGMVFVSTGFTNAELWAIKPYGEGSDAVAPVIWKWLRGAAEAIHSGRQWNGLLHLRQRHRQMPRRKNRRAALAGPNYRQLQRRRFMPTA